MLNLVYDRTQADVNARNDKGTYNYTDYNRVESAVAYLANLLTQNGYITTVTTKTTWGMGGDSNEPWDTEMSRYLNNILYIAAQFYNPNTLPTIPDDILQFQNANAIEEFLTQIEIYIQNMIDNYRYCGTFYAGEDIL